MFERLIFFLLLRKMLIRRSRALGHNKVTRKPLFFVNPYRSIGVVNPSSRIFVGPIRREGITSVENAERARSMLHLSQLTNAGMVKQMKDLGIIPDDLGVDLGDYSGNSVSLPEGVTSVENLEKKGDIARQVERFNAGILDQEQRQQKAFLELAKKKKKDEYRKSIIKWLALTDELDQVPNEFAEEVAAYYRAHEDVNQADIEKKRRERRKKEDKKIQKQLERQRYWYQTNPLDRALQVTNSPTGHGWRAVRLHKSVRPLRKYNYLPTTLANFLEQRKQELDKRRERFKEKESEQRGLTPTKDAVETAMPKLAEPVQFSGDNVIRQRYPRPEIV